MEIDDLDCSLCQSLYNLSNKLPRLLTKCGHTFCQECLISGLESGIHNCPENCHATESISSIEDLPKNMTVINIMQKIQKRKKTIPKETNTKSDSNSSLNLPTNISNLAIEKPPMQSRHTLTQLPIPAPDFNPLSTCLQHRRPLEIVCLDHCVKICTTCALFGDHKNHSLRSEDDIIKETSIKAEILIQYYEIIEKNADKFEEESQGGENITHLIGKVKAKSDKMKEMIRNYFSELRFILETKENMLIEEVHLKFEKEFMKKCEIYETYKNSVFTKVFSWRKE
jgi:hypothetical protein